MMKKLITQVILVLIIIFCRSETFAQECHPYKISWDPVTNPNVEQVCIYRSRNNFENPIMIGSVSSSFTEYTDDSPLNTGVLYCYALRSKSSDGNYSGYSSVVTGLTLNESSSGELKNLCKIDSVTALDDSTYAVHWSTKNPSIGFILFKKWQSSIVDSTDVSGSFSCNHYAVLENFQPNTGYNLKAVSYFQYERGVVVSVELPFVTESEEGDVNFVLDQYEITVDEGDSGQILLWLDSEPAVDVLVNIRRVSGDSTLSVSSASEVTFGIDNWDTGQIVIISAAEDIDLEDGYASFVLEDEESNIPIEMFVVNVIDNDESSSPDGVSASQVYLYPQPFNPDKGNLKINNLPENGEITIYNLTGSKVWNTNWSGANDLEWEGLNNSNTGVSSGRYFVVIKDLTSNIISKKAILVVR